jgi:hypothetical protein
MMRNRFNCYFHTALAAGVISLFPLACSDDSAETKRDVAVQLDVGTKDVGTKDGGTKEASIDAKLPAEKFLLSGTVTVGNAAAAPLKDVEVQVFVDGDKDGQFVASEAQATKTDPAGVYQLEVPVQQGAAVLLQLKLAGYATMFRRLVVGPGAELVLDFSLAKLEDLQCADAKCSIEGNKLSLEGLPGGAKGSVRVFNPAAETDKFPGSFRESTGQFLRSGVFAAIELQDSANKPLHQLTAPATLRLIIPQDTWKVISDVTPGNGKIDVPLYSFDETKGTWVKEGQGMLEDGSGQSIPEDRLTAIHNGSFTAPVIVRGEITHLSYWNLDWPEETHGCLTGTVVGSDGKPALGATVFFGGVSYTAYFEPTTVGSDGHFCLEVFRSEKADEDLDSNGLKGEQRMVSLHVAQSSKVYEQGHFAAGTVEGNCGSSTCVDLGNIVLSSDKEIKTALEGHWAGDWGDMLLKKVGNEFWGAYLHDEGTVIVRMDPDGVFRGWWTEVPSRNPPNDAGEVEFRFSWNGEVLGLDGRWRYGLVDEWQENWDLARTTEAVPTELEDRFKTPAAFQRHP